MGAVQGRSGGTPLGHALDARARPEGAAAGGVVVALQEVDQLLGLERDPHADIGQQGAVVRLHHAVTVPAHAASSSVSSGASRISRASAIARRSPAISQVPVRAGTTLGGTTVG